MADLYGSNAYSPTPSSSSASLPLESEDLSTFLQQFLRPSCASSTGMQFRGGQLGLQNERSRIGVGPSTFVAPSSTEINFGEAGGYFGDDGSRKGFSFVDGIGDDQEVRVGNDSIDFWFDNENGGGVTSEMCTNPVKSRSSSKRSRAAEVHNLSEKRRRSRINEKLKALQKLIPNSNKSDKASMLDEAIEYLKQLQLQVQMLSMRNGVSLHPLCMPGVAQPLHMPHEGTSYGGGNDMLLSMGKEVSVQPSFEISNRGNSSNQPVQHALNNIANSEVAFGLDGTLEAHYKSFNFSSQSKIEETQLLDARKS